MYVPNPFVYEKTFLSDIKGPAISSLIEEQYAQCGEDLIVSSLIRSLISGGYLSQLNKLVSVEIGANHAYAGSNTYLLSQNFGIKSILIEANPALIPDLIKSRSDAMVLNIAIVDNDSDFVSLYVSNHSELSSLDKSFVDGWHDGTIGVASTQKVQASRINQVLKQTVQNDQKILFLSVDVEGLDLRILADIDYLAWRPLIIQAEPSEHHAPGETSRITELMYKNGYRLFAMTRVNLIFIDLSVFDFLLFPNNIASELELGVDFSERLKMIKTYAENALLNSKLEAALEKTALVEAEMRRLQQSVDAIRSGRVYRLVKFLADCIKSLLGK